MITNEGPLITSRQDVSGRSKGMCTMGGEGKVHKSALWRCKADCMMRPFGRVFIINL